MPRMDGEEAARREAERQALIKPSHYPPKGKRWRLDECVTSSEAGRQLGVSRQAVRNMVQDGFIQGTRVGNTVLVPKVEIERVRSYVPRKRGRHRNVRVVQVPPNIVEIPDIDQP